MLYPLLQVVHLLSVAKKEKSGFDAGENRTPAYRADVEEAAWEYAKSRPCTTRKATPKELAELDRLLAKKGSRK